MKSTECLRFVCLSLLLVASALTFAACSDPEQQKADHVSRGEAYLKDKKYQEASLEFRNAVQIDDGLAAAHWGLARSYEGLLRGSEMFDELKRTLQLDPNNLEARTKLGNYYLAAARQDNPNRAQVIDEAERLAKEVLERNANDIEGHILMAGVFAARGDMQKALASLNRAVDIDPKRVESHLSLARFYASQQNTAKAEETLKRAIALNDRSALAHIEYAKFLAQTNRLNESEAEFKRAIEVEPDNRDAHTILAQFYFVNKQMDKAEEAFRRLAELDRDKPEGRAVLADFYSSVGRTDDAINTYKEINAKAPDYTRGRYRLAEILLQRGDTQGASALTQEVLSKNDRDTQALLINARIKLQGGDTKSAIEDLKTVLNIEPNSLAALYFMAEATLREGQIDQARVYAGDLERFYPDYLPAKLLQVQINLAARDANTALRLANELVARLNQTAPNAQISPQLLAELKAKTLTARGMAQASLGKTAEARRDMEAAREVAPNSPASYVNLAAVALRDNKGSEAQSLYERALSIDNTNFDALSGLVNLLGAQNRAGEAHQRIDQAIAQRPNSAPLHYLKAQAYGYEKNTQGAESELRRALELDPKYLAAYFALGSLYINTNQQDRAVAEYRNVLARRSDDVAAHTLIGMIEDSRKNYDASAESYRKALEFDQNSVIAANNLAWMAAEHGKGNLDEAVRLAQGVVQRYPDEAGFIDTLGWVYYKKGLTAPAIEQLKKAVTITSSKGADSPLYRYHLGMAYAGAGSKADARRELEQALRLGEGKNFAQAEDARRALANL